MAFYSSLRLVFRKSRGQPLCRNRGCNCSKASFSHFAVHWKCPLFFHQSKWSSLLGITFSSMYLCISQIPAIPPFVEQSASFLSVFAAGEPCVTDKAVPIEAVDAETEGSLVIVCPSHLPRDCISLMSRDLMVSTLPVSQKTMFSNQYPKRCWLQVCSCAH